MSDFNRLSETEDVFNSDSTMNNEVLLDRTDMSELSDQPVSPENTKQYCKRITMEEYHRESEENTKAEVDNIMKELNDSNLKSKYLNRSVSESNVVDVSSDNMIDTLLKRQEKMYNDMNSLKEQVVENDKELVKLETQEYRQRLELQNKNIELEEKDEIIKTLEKEIKDIKESEKWIGSSFIHANTLIFVQFSAIVTLYSYIKFFI